MRKNHKFTKKDDIIIRREVRKSPMNLSNAFRISADKIGSTFSSVQKRYYNQLRHTGLCFTTISGNKTLPNTKIVSSRTKNIKSTKTCPFIWRAIKSFFKIK
jgi:hypothetical protein